VRAAHFESVFDSVNWTWRFGMIAVSNRIRASAACAMALAMDSGAREKSLSDDLVQSVPRHCPRIMS
jgi:hypothetical protein